MLFAPSLAGVDARFRAELERVESLIAEGNYVAARGILDGLLAREPSGPALEAARAFERMLELDPSFLPSLRALASAVESGDDREAAAILQRISLRRPRGRVLELLAAYRRILDGRAVVSSLRLRLECREEKVETPPQDAPEGARFARLFLVAENALGKPVELETGPATLFVTRSVVGRGGIENDAVETRTYESLRRLSVEPSRPEEVSLARFFVAAADGEVASRMRFELDLRSGSAWILDAAEAAAHSKPRPGAKAPKTPEGREVPVMHFRVADAEVTALEARLRDLPAATPEEFAALASAAKSTDLAAALAVAVRIPPGERERTVDLLAPIVRELPEDAVRSLIPSLRWIAVTSEPGGNPVAWRAWLREREARKAGERPNLLLPKSMPERPDQ